jgi:predicted amino acid dehydrogenase
LGNTSTAVIALETASEAVTKMTTLGQEQGQLKHGMVVGATGSIGSACIRMLMQQGV